MDKVIDVAKQAEKRERRAERLAKRVQTVRPFRTNQEVTGLPNHEYAMATKTVRKQGRNPRSFEALVHQAGACRRCQAEQFLVL